MARYSSAQYQFRPFEYNELLAPVLLADTEHKALQEQFGELSNKASVWEGMASQESDPFAYSLYQNYANDLEGAADMLATQGLNPRTRQQLTQLRSRYNREIQPIETAYNRRMQLVDEQRQARIKDSTTLFDRDASSLSLDDLIANPALSPQSYSGALLTQQVAQGASQLAKEIRNNPREWRRILGGQYFETIQQNGFRPEEIVQVLQGNPEGSEILQNLLNGVLSSSGIGNWDSNPETYTRAYDYAAQGLWSAVGDTRYETQTDRSYDYAWKDYLARQQENRALARAALKAQEDDSIRGRRLNYQTVPKIGVDSQVQTTKLSEDLETLRRINSNPELVLNETATRIVTQSPYGLGTSIPGASGTSRTREETYYPARETLQRLTEQYGTQDINAISQQLQTEIQASALKSYQYQFNLTDNNLMAQDLRRTLRSASSFTGEVPLKKVKNGSVGKQADQTDIENITSDGNLVLDPELGLLFNAVDKKGKTQQYWIDFSVLDNNQGALRQIWNNIKTLQDNGYGAYIGGDVSQFIDELDDRFNSIAKIQGKTSDKVGPVDASYQNQQDQSFLEAYGAGY